MYFHCPKVFLVKNLENYPIIIKTFHAHENSFFFHIFLSRPVFKGLFKIGQSSVHTAKLIYTKKMDLLPTKTFKKGGGEKFHGGGRGYGNGSLRCFIRLYLDYNDLSSTAWDEERFFTEDGTAQGEFRILKDFYWYENDELYERKNYNWMLFLNLVTSSK